jgi:hypothetical protein
MSGSRLFIVAAAGGAIAAIAWWQWPRAQPAPVAPPATATPPAPAPPIAVRRPDKPMPTDGTPLDVRDGRGTPVVDVEVRATSSAGTVAEAATDDTGRAVLALTPGRWQLVVADHQITGAAQLELGAVPAAPLDLVVEGGVPAALPEPPAPGPRPAGVVGVVTAGGARLADFTVAPVFLGGYGPGHTVVNDHIPQPIPLAPRRFIAMAGGFRWDGLAPGSYLLRVSSAGYGTREVRTVADAGGFGDGSIALAPAASLSGTVSDGRAVPIADVVVRGTVNGAVVAQTRTSPQGIYLLENLPAGPIVVSVATSKGECIGDDQTITVVAGQRTTQRLEMTCAWQGH